MEATTDLFQDLETRPQGENQQGERHQLELMFIMGLPSVKSSTWETTLQGAGFKES